MDTYQIYFRKLDMLFFWKTTGDKKDFPKNFILFLSTIFARW